MPKVELGWSLRLEGFAVSKISLSHNERVMNVSFSGMVTIDDVATSIKERIEFNNGDAIKKINILVIDFTDVESIDMSAEDIKLDVELNQKVARSNPYLTIIGIMPGPLAFGLSRMWQAYAEFSPANPWRQYLVRTVKEANAIIEDTLNLG